MFKAKILVVGPCESGKTWVANFLAEATESSGGEYHPTQGVRVLEFESEGEDPEKGTPFKAEVELWDCSGSRRFESCWPAFWKDTTGVLMVFNPDVPQHLKELEKWYTSFIVKQKLKDRQCMIFAHHRPNAPEVPRQPLDSPKLSKVQCVYTDLETNPDSVREEFNNFLISLIANWKDNQEEVEQGIVSASTQ